MSQKMPPYWERRAGKDLRGTSVKRHIKRCTHRVNRRTGKAEVKVMLGGKDSHQRRLTEVAHKAISIHHDYAEASYFSYQMSPDGYGDAYLADREDQAIADLCRKYGLTVDEVESEVMRLCYEDGAYDSDPGDDGPYGRIS